MGGADIIPGVSGGTMALIVGIYERLIGSISSVFGGVVGAVRLDGAAVRERFREVEWGLVLPLALGILTALLVGARFIPHLLETYPMHALGLFFGLVAASLYVPWQRIGHRGVRQLGIGLLMALLAFLLTGIPPAEIADPSLLFVFASAAVAICAMILPGVSGAFLLKVLGIYETTLLALNERDVLYVLVFIAGAAVGLGLFSRLLDYLLEHYHDLTMAALVGLMAGALRALWPWQGADRELSLPAPGDPVLPVILLGIVGFAFVLALVLWSDRLERQAVTGRG